jgi:Icc-related predicted phosphoesterase
MRILTISDQVIESLHSPALLNQARDVELVISCGDLPADYLEYIVSMLNVPLLYVMGNHASDGGEKLYPEGCENIHGRVVEHAGLLIAGLEGSMRYNNRPKFQYTENEMRAQVVALAPMMVLNRARYGRSLDILVTHAPPYKIHDGEDLAHHGFKAFVWFIDNYKPRYLFHGHMHIYDGRTEMVTQRGATTIINTYGFKIIDVPVLKLIKK